MALIVTTTNLRSVTNGTETDHGISVVDWADRNRLSRPLADYLSDVVCQWRAYAMSGYEAIEEAIRRLRTSENIYDHVSQRKAMAEINRLHSRLAAARARVAALEEQVYVPGLWRCAKCKFTLMQATLRASDGAVGSRDATGDKCPNCNTGLWRVTERDAGNDLVDRCDEQMQRAVTAEARIAALEGVIATMDEALAANAEAWRCAADACQYNL